MLLGIFPSVVTTDSHWRNRIQELKDLNIHKAAFFPTCLIKDERLEAYYLLKEANVTHIPLVHLRNDMSGEEVRFLQHQFKTNIFNIHSPFDDRYGPKNDLSEFKNNIYVENSTYPWKNSIDDWAGICLDVTHLEAETISNGEVLTDWLNGLNKYSVGVWHVSAIYNPGVYRSEFKKTLYDWHKFDRLDRFDYVKKYKKYLPKVIALELENTIQEQLRVKNYLEKLLS